MKKKLLCIFFVLIFALSAFPLGVFASSDTSQEWRDLSSTSIEEDFEYVFGNKYSIKDFVDNSEEDVEEDKRVLNLISIMQSYDSENNCTDLYLYIHNPYRKELYRKSDKNNLHLSVYNSNNDKGKDDYFKAKIDLIGTYNDTSEDENLTNSLVLKYKVPNVNKGAPGGVTRIYNVVEFELFEKEKATAQAYLVGRTFEFSLNEIEGRKYVSCVDKELSVLETDAYHTFYRVNTEGINQYRDIQSVYFAIPNALIESFGTLWSMKCVWDTYQTNNILATDSTLIESAFEDWMYGYNPYNSDLKYSVVYGDVAFDMLSFQYGYNVEAMESYKSYDAVAGWDGLRKYDYEEYDLIGDFRAPFETNYDYPLSMVFVSDNLESHEEKIVDGQEILDYLNSHRVFKDGQFVFDESMISKTSSNEMTFKVYYSLDVGNVWEKCSGWSAFWSGIYYDVPTDEYVSLDVFQEIDMNDVNRLSIDEFSKKYYVDKNDFRCLSGKCGECLQCRVTDEEYKDCTWFLLRYDCTEYQSYSALVCDNKDGETHQAAVFNGGVVDNFDSIQITLREIKSNGDRVYNTFPIGRSPSQFAVDGWSPEKLEKADELLFGNKNPFEWLENVLKIALIVLTVFVVIKIVLPLLPKRTKIKIQQERKREDEKKK